VSPFFVEEDQVSWFGKSDLQQTVEETVKRVVQEVTQHAETALSAVTNLSKLERDINTLKKEKNDLLIESGRRDEEFKRREREIEHKVGLERKRQEFERDQAKREAVVEVREKNLDADRKRFEEQMQFHQNRFEQEVKYLHEMMDSVLKRLPDASIIAKIGGKSGSR
jgi:hypothetical protein